MKNIKSLQHHHPFQIDSFETTTNYHQLQPISSQNGYGIADVEQVNNAIEEYLQYLHVLQLLPLIAKFLGINGFVSEDKFMNLYKKYHGIQFGEVCKLCLQVRVEGLLLNFNEQSRILKQICITKFPNLHTLDLSGNLIESLEYLSMSYMPSLAFLNLSANHITNLRPLRRLWLQNLYTIDLTSNYYSQIPDMMPGIEIQFDRRVVQKSMIYKVVVTVPSVQLLRNGLRMMDYFR